jgi:beta-glucosidase
MTTTDRSPTTATSPTPSSSAPRPPVDHRALVASLDLATRVRLLTGATAFTLAPEESIGLGELRLSDGPTGVRGLKFSGGRTVALFPNATLLASAWSEAVTEEVGRLLAEEALAQQIHVVLGPTINLHRSLLGGRLFEQFSEDPLLTGKLAAAYVRGMQALGVAACLKHLIANESETERNTMNSVVDEVTLRELYLLPFEIAVEDSNAWSIMAAYNDINGVPATEQDHVINEVLKDEWGYDGLVMSDWFATKSAAPAAAGGLDLVMPGPQGPWGEALVRAVESGDLAESVVDEHLRRLLVLAERVGALGTLRDYPEQLPTPDSAARKEQLTRLAAGGLTVLTNSGVLPLARGTSIALIGRHAIETICMGGGSAHVNPPYEISVADGLGALLGDAVTVTDGVEVRVRPVIARGDFVSDPGTGEPGTHVELYTGDGTLIQQRHNPGSDVVVGFDDDFDEVVSRVVIRAAVEARGEVEVGVIGVGDWVLTAGGETFDFAPRLLGTGMGEELLSPPLRTAVVTLDGPGIVEASVRLAASEPGVKPHPVMVGLIARPAARPVEDALAEAVRAAAAAEVAVVVVGLTEEQETESVDKSTLALPGAQDALVSAVAAAAKRTVVVVNSATPVLMPWLDEVDAVLWAGLPGQEGGHAIAAALLGDIEPAGRLVTTFPVADGAAPAWSVTPVDGDLPYSEGTFIGYRGHHAGRAPEPAFWFGHGLGYSTWEYTEPVLRTDVPEPDRSVPQTVLVTVTNTGARPSREVVQVYFEPAEDDQPVRLVGWTAVTAERGQSVDVAVATDQRLWRRWDTATGTWARLSGGGRLLVARGLGDVRGTVSLVDS